MSTSQFVPAFVDANTLELVSSFFAEACLAYAKTHRFNVEFSDTAKIALAFKNEGFSIDIYGKPQTAPGGMKLKPKPVFVFKYNEKIHTEED